jgi:hypothetical protein
VKITECGNIEFYSQDKLQYFTFENVINVYISYIIPVSLILTFLIYLQGSDHLTVTWKVADGIMQHIDVKEEGKENAFSLGTSLIIGTEVLNQC